MIVGIISTLGFLDCFISKERVFFFDWVCKSFKFFVYESVYIIHKLSTGLCKISAIPIIPNSALGKSLIF